MARSKLAVALAAVALGAQPARAALKDHGPGDPALVFPTWYRDLNGVALNMCLSQTPSPNPGAALKPFCFPLNPDPAGFPGNVGPEIFYSDLTATVQKGNPSFALKYLAALEATYLPLGQPVHGTETVFARVRIVITTQVPGTYKVTHPYGVEVFAVKAADLGPRAVFFTADMPLGPALDFDSALQGRVGPFPQWDFVDPGLTLDVTNAAGATESYVGDPNFAHTFTGSPFGTNFIRVDGPPGSNLDGAGNDFIQTPLATVVGQKHLAPIATPLTIDRAAYAVDAARGVTSVDVHASSTPGSQLVLTGAGLPSVQMSGDVTGHYFSHVEIPAAQVAPAAVSVTNASSNPSHTVTQGVVDVVQIGAATFDTLTRALAVTAASSDRSAFPPALTVAGPLGGAMTAGSFGAVLAAGVLPPARVSVVSSAGGVDSDDVVVLPGLTDAPPFAPVAVPDAATTPSNAPVSLDVTANDAVTPPAAVASVKIVGLPAQGTVAAAASGGVVTYTPAATAAGVDTFQYVLVDSAGAVSNVATVSVNVQFVPVGPAVGNDDFALLQNKSGAPSSRRYDVLANDVAAPGTVLDPASIVITVKPLHGTATPNADGTVTYTPLLNYVGSDAFVYTVANGQGVASGGAIVNVVVEGGAEAVSIAKATYVAGKNQWTIVGSTNWFGPTLLHTTATCWVGRTAGAGPLLGTTAVDTAGKFQLVPPPLTTPAPDATALFTCRTSNGGAITAAVAFK